MVIVTSKHVVLLYCNGACSVNKGYKNTHTHTLDWIEKDWRKGEQRKQPNGSKPAQRMRPNLDLREDKLSLGLTKSATSSEKKHWRNYIKHSQKAWRKSMNIEDLFHNTVGNMEKKAHI